MSLLDVGARWCHDVLFDPGRIVGQRSCPKTRWLTRRKRCRNRVETPIQGFNGSKRLEAKCPVDLIVPKINPSQLHITAKRWKRPSIKWLFFLVNRNLFRKPFCGIELAKPPNFLNRNC